MYYSWDVTNTIPALNLSSSEAAVRGRGRAPRLLCRCARQGPVGRATRGWGERGRACAWSAARRHDGGGAVADPRATRAVGKSDVLCAERRGEEPCPFPFLCHASELRLAPGLCLYRPRQIHEPLDPLLGTSGGGPPGAPWAAAQATRRMPTFSACAALCASSYYPWRETSTSLVLCRCPPERVVKLDGGHQCVAAALGPAWRRCAPAAHEAVVIVRRGIRSPWTKRCTEGEVLGAMTYCSPRAPHNVDVNKRREFDSTLMVRSRRRSIFMWINSTKKLLDNISFEKLEISDEMNKVWT
jgi:hypothetical protein